MKSRIPAARERDSIEDARRHFSAELLASGYARVHWDAEQLERLVDDLAVEARGVYLDLATGGGYVAFEIARRFPDCRVIGVDIAETVIAKNTENASRSGLSNTAFAVSDGVNLFFRDDTFDGVVCRYALHHFPRIETTLEDVRAALKPSGRLIVSDPVRNEGDEGDFINRFQRLQRDGHVRIYEQDAFMALFRRLGFRADARHTTSITFSRDLTPDYASLLSSASSRTLEGYAIDVKGDKVFARFDILNVVFTKD